MVMLSMSINDVRIIKKTTLNLIIFVSSVFLLSACVTSVPVDRSGAILMPDRVAKDVLSSRLGNEWVEHPYFNKSNNFYCKNKKFPIIFEQISYVFYRPTKQVVSLQNYPDGQEVNPFGLVAGFLFCDSIRQGSLMSIDIPVLNESEAQEITEALIALHAPITAYIKH